MKVFVANVTDDPESGGSHVLFQSRKSAVKYAIKEANLAWRADFDFHRSWGRSRGCEIGSFVSWCVFEQEVSE